jgi:hypothetical protein
MKKSEPKLAPTLLAPKTTSQASESAFDNFIAAVVPPAFVEFTKSAVGDACTTSNLTSGLVVPIPTLPEVRFAFFQQLHLYPRKLIVQ